MRPRLPKALLVWGTQVPGLRVLDVGCGFGVITFAFLEAGEESRLQKHRWVRPNSYAVPLPENA